MICLLHIYDLMQIRDSLLLKNNIYNLLQFDGFLLSPYYNTLLQKLDTQILEYEARTYNYCNISTEDCMHQYSIFINQKESE